MRTKPVPEPGAPILTLPAPIQVTDKDPEITTEEMDKILAKMPATELIMTLKERNKCIVGFGEVVLPHVEDEDIIKHLDHINLKDIKACVREKEKIKRKKRELKRLR
jgi:hypothetical protein